ncbi:MAG: hypothetical protein HYV90_04095 [Candidatus Woesebacteria bacterium]|nr:MAG: hypothetical protein HYV90_04095 [Candidatus Woesebacteria bacterium]
MRPEHERPRLYIPPEQRTPAPETPRKEREIHTVEDLRQEILDRMEEETFSHEKFQEKGQQFIELGKQGDQIRVEVARFYQTHPYGQPFPLSLTTKQNKQREEFIAAKMAWLPENAKPTLNAVHTVLVTQDEIYKFHQQNPETMIFITIPPDIGWDQWLKNAVAGHAKSSAFYENKVKKATGTDVIKVGKAAGIPFNEKGIGEKKIQPTKTTTNPSQDKSKSEPSSANNKRNQTKELTQKSQASESRNVSQIKSVSPIEWKDLSTSQQAQVVTAQAQIMAMGSVMSGKPFEALKTDQEYADYYSKRYKELVEKARALAKGPELPDMGKIYDMWQSGEITGDEFDVMWMARSIQDAYPKESSKKPVKKNKSKPNEDKRYEDLTPGELAIRQAEAWAIMGQLPSREELIRMAKNNELGETEWERLIDARNRLDCLNAPNKTIVFGADEKGISFIKLLPDGTLYTSETQILGKGSVTRFQEWAYPDGKRVNWSYTAEEQTTKKDGGVSKSKFKEEGMQIKQDENTWDIYGETQSAQQEGHGSVAAPNTDLHTNATEAMQEKLQDLHKGHEFGPWDSVKN